ncbi:MAG: [FeFe] hydrogenase H-cluster radical SAM maturase HydE [Candidatus Omnitrophica bacterium]|nr:[FeFe] hydrogenase H-cluster radical SAM maturase HydE [Candidatus Omnitrophota bacterium]
MEKRNGFIGQVPAFHKAEIDRLFEESSGNLFFIRSNEVSARIFSDTVYIRGIIEFSSFCVRNCRYCGLRQNNTNIARYRMTPQAIVAAVEKIAASRVKTVVLQSGDDFYYSRKMLGQIISRIKRNHPEMAVTLSVGERSRDDYRAFRDSGADRYLLKHETINDTLYARVHPGQSLKNRIGILEYLRKIGFQVGAGCIIGLPGHTREDLVNEIIFLNDFQPDMIGISPFIPQKDTPLQARVSPAIELVFRMAALARLAVPGAYIPATTALATLGGNKAQSEILRAGANVVMVNFTPEEFSRQYVIYDHKAEIDLKCACKVIHSAGKKVSFARADSILMYPPAERV